MKTSGTTELNSFYPIRPECQNDVPATRFKPRVRFSAQNYVLFLLITFLIVCQFYLTPNAPVQLMLYGMAALVCFPIECDNLLTDY